MHKLMMVGLGAAFIFGAFLSRPAVYVQPATAAPVTIQAPVAAPAPAAPVAAPAPAAPVKKAAAPVKRKTKPRAHIVRYVVIPHSCTCGI